MAVKQTAEEINRDKQLQLQKVEMDVKDMEAKIGRAEKSVGGEDGATPRSYRPIPL